MFNHTMVYDGFRPEDLREGCVEITVWDHDRLNNHHIGGLRLGLGTDTARALGLLEEYCTKLRRPEEQQLKTAIQRVMGIFKSNLFGALLDFVELTRMDFPNLKTEHLNYITVNLEHAPMEFAHLRELEAQDVRPLSALFGEGFRDIMKFFEQGYKIPSHATLWSNIMLQYNTVKARIANEMKDKSVSLTTDLWTSCTMDPYITITVHYITDTWELKSRVLRTTIMPERHTAVNIAQRLKETIEEWDLVVFCTIHDNASSMNLAMELCEQFPHHLGCAGHTIQLAINAGLHLPEIAKTTDAARRIVSHFRHSSVAVCALKKRQEQLGVKVHKLQNDCATRWNSTFTMLERLYEQRLPVQAVLADETVTKVGIRRSLAMSASGNWWNS
ncbi:hypothetical protein JOQ06_018933 [Pogonophryne albipinna]|uniref:L27-1 domain-containing protein n=1 Tax=Pogonophryne albipinna TaxID=1090488 RepID=A0AAD6ARE9_9TELE|nr:hypothetical protein JOQ06_018933 [Pogonophryne albipinna]